MGLPATPSVSKMKSNLSDLSAMAPSLPSVREKIAGATVTIPAMPAMSKRMPSFDPSQLPDAASVMSFSLGESKQSEAERFAELLGALSADAPRLDYR